MKQYLITSEQQIKGRIQNALQILAGQPMSNATLTVAQALLDACLSNLLMEGVLVAIPEVTVQWATNINALVLDFPADWEDSIAKGLP